MYDLMISSLKELLVVSFSLILNSELLLLILESFLLSICCTWYSFMQARGTFPRRFKLIEIDRERRVLIPFREVDELLIILVSFSSTRSLIKRTINRILLPLTSENLSITIFSFSTLSGVSNVVNRLASLSIISVSLKASLALFGCFKG